MTNRDVKRVKFDKYGLFEIAEAGKTVYKSTGDPVNHISSNENFVVIYSYTGEQKYFINNEEYDLSGGNILIVRPGEILGTGEYKSFKKTCYYIVFNIKHNEPFLGMTIEDTKNLYNILKKGKRLYSAENELKNIFNAILTYNKEKNILQSAAYKALLLELFCNIYKSCKKRPEEIPVSVITLGEKIDANPGQKINLVKFALKNNISTRKLNNMFKLYKGMSIVEYTIVKKMEKADILLLDPKLTITDIAFELNFSSSQHFATVYRKYRNTTPTKYREENILNPQKLTV